jgi:hypothetical protein
MMTTSDLVLHALRCIGGAGLARVAAATGLDGDAAESELIDLAVAGLVTHEAGEFGGWSLTADGRAADADRSAAELVPAGVRTAIAAAYERFLVLNPELLDICTAWQTRRVDGVVVANRHDDPAHDTRVLDRLTDLARRADTLCTDLAVALPRFGRYRARLGGALAMARSGRTEYVTDDFEAFHTVWFQLHEDLLATLGLPR